MNQTNYFHAKRYFNSCLSVIICRMLYEVPPLISLHAFESAARHGSFAAAAKELNITQSAISHRIRHLETHLGYSLFERSARSLRLNDMGKAYLPSVQQAFNEISSSTSAIFGSAKRKTVTIRVPVTHAVLWLAPRLESFLNDYPDIDVRVGSALWADLTPGDASDLEIRFGDGNWENFEVILLRQETAIPVCSQQHIDRYGQPDTLEELAARPRISTLGYDNLWLRLFRGIDVDNSNQSNNIWVDTTLAALELAASGNRCAIVPKNFLQSHSITSRLVAVSNAEVTMHEALYLLTPQNKAQISPQAQLFKQWLLAQA